MSNNEDGPPTRDANGRWLKGHCPNPNGRPKKKAQEDYDPSDIRHFGRAMIDVTAGGQNQTMDRRAALIYKMFESAMKGKVSSQRFLYREFQEYDKRLAAVRVEYDQLIMDWVIENPDFKGLDADNIPREVQIRIQELEVLLNHYHPEQYPRPAWVKTGRDDDDSDD
jgi:hypothetical protein